MIRDLAKLSFGLLLTAIGVAGGYLAARQSGAAPPPAKEVPEDPDDHEGHDTHEGHDAHEGHDHATEPAAGGRAFSEQTLRNLGVTVGEARLSDFVVHRTVQAVVVDPPLNRRPVFAALGGIVRTVAARPGTSVAAGDVLVTLARDAIARPKLELTAGILAPLSEDLHRTSAELRASAGEVRIVSQELARVREFTATGTTAGLPVLPRRAEIDLRNDFERATLALANARNELEGHGLSADEVARIERGEPAPASQRIWKSALGRAGLWDAHAEAMLDALPERDRALPWSIAAIGELAAAGLVTPDLGAALAEVPQLAEHFVETTALLLEGHTLATVRDLASAGALAHVAEIRPPREPATDWDVTDVLVRPGQRVEAGEPLVVLHDARSMWLRLEPVGAEVGDVVRALEEGTAVRATPLLPGTGPALDDLRVRRLSTLDGERGSIAFSECANEAVSAPGAAGARSWRLRAGLRYLVRIPAKVLPQRFVLPAGAVADDGPDRVVFVAEGATFRKRIVHVEHEDDEFAVVAPDGTLKPGVRLARTGAFELSLALQTGSAPVDPHAGHGH